jgi:hypothetical protein
MSDSSASAQSSFEGLRQNQAVVLLDILRESTRTERSFVQRRYCEKASGFPETLAFLTTIQALDQAGDCLRIGTDFAEMERQGALGTSGSILRLLLGTDTPYRRELLQYLRQFRVWNGAAIHRPSVESRSAESAVRNYLIDVGILSYDQGASCYRLGREFSQLYAFAVRQHRAMTPAQLKRRLEARETLGMEAEFAMVQFERRRVGAQHEHQVEHVGIRDVAAGYDILSVSLCEDGSTMPRYIEVKAVPLDSQRFFWSENEVAMAELFGAWYYLYLVPAVAGGRIAADAVRIVQDPHAAVLGPESKWIVETGIVQCRLAPDG